MRCSCDSLRLEVDGRRRAADAPRRDTGRRSRPASKREHERDQHDRRVDLGQALVRRRGSSPRCRSSGCRRARRPPAAARARRPRGRAAAPRSCAGARCPAGSRRARGAGRSAARAFRNLASSRPTTLTRHTPRNSSAMPISTRLSFCTTSLRSSQLLDVVELVVERARHAARRLLAARIVVEVRLELVAIGRASGSSAHICSQTHSEFRKSWYESIGLALPAIRVAVDRQLQRAAPAERQVRVLGILERAVVEVEELRARRARLQHADDAVLRLAQLAPCGRRCSRRRRPSRWSRRSARRPARARGRPRRPSRCRTGTARRTSGRTRASSRAATASNGLTPARSGSTSTPDLYMTSAARRGLRAVAGASRRDRSSASADAPACPRRRARSRIPRVDRHGVQPVALLLDRVGRHRVVDREGHRARRRCRGRWRAPSARTRPGLRRMLCQARRRS